MYTLLMKANIEMDMDMKLYIQPAISKTLKRMSRYSSLPQVSML